MSALFGHRRGAFTGAIADRPGLLRQADRGLLFLDEIGELGLEEQAMLLRAIEERAFYPVGADGEARSDFQLIAGSNRDLRDPARFREDLLARIDLWTFSLPRLADRPEDIPPNLDFELERAGERLGRRVTLNKEARAAFLGFAVSSEGRWPANFRDLSASVLRMATLAPGGRIDVPTVTEELARLRVAWGAGGAGDGLERVLEEDVLARLDRFDRVQLAEVVRVVGKEPSLSAAGRALFDRSRLEKSSVNDADRLRKYLGKYGLSFEAIRSG